MKRFTLRLEDSVHERLREESFATGVSINDMIVGLVKEKYGIGDEEMKEVKVFTSLTGTEYDVDDYLTEVEKYSGPIKFNNISSERIFFQQLQKQAIINNYKLVWITRSIDNKVTIGTIIDNSNHSVVGFGVSPKEKEDELNVLLNVAKEKIEKATDEAREQSLVSYYKNKLK